MKYLIIMSVLLLQHLFASDDYYYENHKKISLSKMPSIIRANTKVQYYQTQRGDVVGISDKLILKLKKDDNLKKYLIDFNLTMQNKLSKDMYLLKTTNKTLTINIANRLSEKNDVEYAQPDFIQKRELR